MPCPPSGRTVLLAAVGLCPAAVAADPAAAQATGPEEVGISLVANAVGSGIVALIVAGGFVALAPDYAERTTDRIRSEPVETFVYGLAIGIAAVIVGVLLVLTLVGVLVAVPMFLALGVVGYLGYLAVGRSVSDDWGIALVVAIVLATLTGAVPILGGLLGLVISSTGIGAAYLDYRDDGETRGSRRGREPRTRGGDRRARNRENDERRRPGANRERSGIDDEDDPAGPR